MADHRRGTGRLIDISPPVGPDAPVWPGDTAYRAEVHWPMTDGSPVVVHRYETTPHVGAHADAPAHFLPGGATIDAVALEPYVGPCQVVHCLPGPSPRSVVTLADVHAALARTRGPVAPRLLIRTYRVFPATWVDDFPGLAPDVPAWLSAQGGVLVGMDTASLDPRTSTDMAAHRAAAAHDLAILENLRLDQVAEGRYELIALPLRLAGLDASPVRAVLR
jgi:arylformamidase